MEKNEEALAFLQEEAERQGHKIVPLNIENAYLQAIFTHESILSSLDFKEGILFRQGRWWVRTKSFVRCQDAINHRGNLARRLERLEPDGFLHIKKEGQDESL